MHDRSGETFGFIHIEAAAQGLPVIAFNMSANCESILNIDANTVHGGTADHEGSSVYILPYAIACIPTVRCYFLMLSYTNRCGN